MANQAKRCCELAGEVFATRDFPRGCWYRGGRSPWRGESKHDVESIWNKLQVRNRKNAKQGQLSLFVKSCDTLVPPGFDALACEGVQPPPSALRKCSLLRGCAPYQIPPMTLLCLIRAMFGMTTPNYGVVATATWWS